LNVTIISTSLTRLVNPVQEKKNISKKNQAHPQNLWVRKATPDLQLIHETG